MYNGLIKYKGKVWLGDNVVAQQHVLQVVHQSIVGGHSGVLAIYHRIKQLFHWPGLKQAMKDFVATCAICQQVKVEHVRQPGLLQPLPIADQAWKTVCMDFIEGLPKSQKFDTILVIVDKFTKYGHFIPLAHPFTAMQTA